MNLNTLAYDAWLPTSVPVPQCDKSHPRNVTNAPRKGSPTSVVGALPCTGYGASLELDAPMVRIVCPVDPNRSVQFFNRVTLFSALVGPKVIAADPDVVPCQI